MLILSWNVNGIRAVVKKGFKEFLENKKPDILLLQETKIAQKDIAKQEFDFAGYEEFWWPAERPGYSGTAILVKNRKSKVISYKMGLDEYGEDVEGRVQTLELDNCYIVNCYFPNANHELSRLKFKMDFNERLLKHLKNLEKKKPVLIGGDFNVAHQEMDLKNPKENIGNPGFTYEERGWIDEFIKTGFIDTYRTLHPDKIEYSWWSYRFFARNKNIGWRIDYFFASKALKNKIKKAFILPDVTGSDHCPVGVIIE